MPTNYRGAAVSRARRKQLQRRRERIIIVAGAVVIALVVLLIVLVVPKGNRTDQAVTANANTAAPTTQPLVAEEFLAQATEPPTVEDTAVPTPAPTPAPVDPDARSAEERALTRPTATAEGFIPVFKSADTDEKIIAITVDDCFQAENLQKIVDLAIQYGGKLTIFPIGQNVLRERQAEILKYAWEQGFELENHTFTHNGLYRCDDQELAEEIYKQQLSLSYILGVEYHCHFLRPRGGDARADQRLQKYAEQMGYYGIAHWSVSGRAGDETLVKSSQPGAIFLFHTTDADLEILERYIPWITSKGFKLVTLNEMFGYPENETSPLTMKPSEYPIPTLAPFERVYVSYKKTSYAYGAYLLQEKLIELGYLNGEPDGVYGEGSANAIRAYQRDHGLEVTGVADPATQEMIFGGVFMYPSE